MQIAACQTFRAAYLHSRITTTLSASTTDRVIVVVNHLLSIIRLQDARSASPCSAVVRECPPRLVA